MNRMRVEAVADGLRKKNAEQVGVEVDDLLLWHQLAEPERVRWTGMAVAALEALDEVNARAHV